MAVPTVFGVTLPREFFQVLLQLALALAYVSLFIALMALCWMVVTTAIRPKTILRWTNSSPPRRRRLIGCVKCTEFVGRKVCVIVFPALFKALKTRSNPDSPTTREFVVCLDRKVGRGSPLVLGFVSIACTIVAISAMVFFRYFPVERSLVYECREEDHHGRPLFCYSNTSSRPLDCAEHDATGLQYECYAFAIPTGLGIAVAATLAIAKVAIVTVTVYAKVTEGFFMMTRKYSRKLEECGCCGGSERANKICVYSNLVVLIAIAMVASVLIYIATWVPLVLKLEFLVYLILAVLMSFNLGIIVIPSLENHCKQGEYINVAADQRPHDPRDWDIDVESGTERLQDVSATNEPALGENDNEHSVPPMETEETQSFLATNSTYGSVQA